MVTERERKIVRQFAENGLKLLLEDPENVRDFLSLVAAWLVDRIDFSGMKVLGTTFVQRDYRHVESDLVLTVPLRKNGRRSKRNVLLYILIEHQSEPDELILFRVLEYLVAIYRSQVRKWAKGHKSLRGVRLQPVLPVVFYTGTRTWETLGSLTDLMEEGGAIP